MGCVSKKSISIIIEVFKKQKESLIVVGALAVGYILVSALVVISIEPETFPTFFNAVYWATVSLTTVGYGVSVASISNWKRAYREECQTNDEEKTQLELMEEVRKLC
ncbi:MAG: two pore domain potassium channel family protein [Lachnospiraceae bacterium]|nr:two pore domain potassium channel family protein [Lachnospiraceae bacterium]